MLDMDHWKSETYRTNEGVLSTLKNTLHMENGFLSTKGRPTPALLPGHQVQFLAGLSGASVRHFVGFSTGFSENLSPVLPSHSSAKVE
jgi:hypothetical protein